MPTCATRLVVLLLALSPARALAGSALTLELAEGCPDGARFHERMGELLADRPAPTTGLVRVTREASGYRLDVETEDVSRTLYNEHCAELVESAAVIVALGAAARDEPEPPPPRVEEPVRPPPAPAPPVPRTVESPARALAAWLEASGSYGLVPKVALRPALGLSYGTSRVGGALGIDYVLARESDERQGVRAQAAGGNLGAYVAFTPRLTLTLGGDFHLLWGRGHGVRDARSGRVPLWCARVALMVTLLERRSLQLRLVVAGGAPFARGRFRYADGGTAYRPEIMHGSLGLAFGFARVR